MVLKYNKVFYLHDKIGTIGQYPIDALLVTLRVICLIKVDPCYYKTQILKQSKNFPAATLSRDEIVNILLNCVVSQY